MRTSLVLFAACGIISCRKAEPVRAPQTEQQRIEARYKGWAARQPRPGQSLVDHVETLLAREPCIGSLGRWSRFYGYNRLPEKTVDTGIVDFHLEEAGAFDVKAGRHITEPDSWVNIDDRPIKMVSGDYDVKENRIRIDFCGSNVGGPQQGGVNNMSTYFAELKRRRLAHAS